MSKDNPYYYPPHQLTDDPAKADHPYHFNEAITKKIDLARELAIAAKPRSLAKLLKCRKEHPRVPQFLNFLMQYYRTRKVTPAPVLHART